MKRLAWLLVLLLSPLFIVFAVANRHIVTLSLDPTPILIEAPLYSIVLASAFIGIMAGGFIVWLQGFRWRSRLQNKYQSERRHKIELREPNGSTNSYKKNPKEIIKTA